ncbi:ABC transporter substrate-binding protein [Undibacter mobilis]|nr:ABC transporter substrate-binding protein [Undibacter mobilis]
MTSRRGRISKIFALAMALVLLSAGSHAAQAADNVSLRLHWLVNGSTVAFYLGLERGYFKDAGINLTINEGKGSMIAAQVVGSGSEQFGTADAVSIIQSEAKGMPIKAIMTIQDVGALGVLWSKTSDIKAMKDLKGKRMGVTAGDALTQQWPVVAESNGLTKDSVNLAYMDGAAKPVSLLNGQVDAILGACIDHVVLLESKGFPVQCQRFADYGVPTVGVSLLTNENLIKNNPDLVKRFVAASVKSYKAFYEDPQAALDAAVRARPDIDRKVVGGQAELIKAYYSAAASGRIDRAKWQSTVEVMKKTGVLSSDRPFDSYFVADFVQP